MDQEVLRKKQRKILAVIRKKQKARPVKKVEGLLRTLRDCNTETAVCALGDIGEHLSRFAKSVDLDNPHPDLFNLEYLTDTAVDSFASCANDVLRLVELAKEHGISSVLSGLSLVTARHHGYRRIYIWDSPQRTNRNIRFISDAFERDRIRANKRSQLVDCRSRINQIYPNSPSDFDGYHRFENRYKSEIADAKAKFQHFQSMGLTSFALTIQATIDRLEHEVKTQQCCGFNRISLNTAAIILGKMMGLTLDDGPHLSFGGLSNMFGFELSIYAESIWMEYQPKVFPYHELESIAPDQVRKVIERLESFPELNGKPVFDHYYVLAPTFDGFTIFGFREQSGEVKQYTWQSEAHRELDRYLIKSGLVPAVLLGDLDGEMYFICYWL